MAEKVRRQTRFCLSLPLWVRIRKQLEGKSRSGKTVVAEETLTENISTTGCYFFLSGKPPLGSVAEMEITVSGDYTSIQIGTLHCRGKVVRVEDRSARGKVGVACAIESYSFSTPAERFGGSASRAR